MCLLYCSTTLDFHNNKEQIEKSNTYNITNIVKNRLFKTNNNIQIIKKVITTVKEQDKNFQLYDSKNQYIKYSHENQKDYYIMKNLLQFNNEIGLNKYIQNKEQIENIINLSKKDKLLFNEKSYLLRDIFNKLQKENFQHDQFIHNLKIDNLKNQLFKLKINIDENNLLNLSQQVEQQISLILVNFIMFRKIIFDLQKFINISIEDTKEKIQLISSLHYLMELKNFYFNKEVINTFLNFRINKIIQIINLNKIYNFDELIKFLNKQFLNIKNLLNNNSSGFNFQYKSEKNINLNTKLAKNIYSLILSSILGLREFVNFQKVQNQNRIFQKTNELLKLCKKYETKENKSQMMEIQNILSNYDYLFFRQDYSNKLQKLNDKICMLIEKLLIPNILVQNIKIITKANLINYFLLLSERKYNETSNSIIYENIYLNNRKEKIIYKYDKNFPSKNLKIWIYEVIKQFNIIKLEIKDFSKHNQQLLLDIDTNENITQFSMLLKLTDLYLQELKDFKLNPLYKIDIKNYTKFMTITFSKNIVQKFLLTDNFDSSIHLLINYKQKLLALFLNQLKINRNLLEKYKNLSKNKTKIFSIIKEINNDNNIDDQKFRKKINHITVCINQIDEIHTYKSKYDQFRRQYKRKY